MLGLFEKIKKKRDEAAEIERQEREERMRERAAAVKNELQKESGAEVEEKERKARAQDRVEGVKKDALKK